MTLECGSSLRNTRKVMVPPSFLEMPQTADGKNTTRMQNFLMEDPDLLCLHSWKWAERFWKWNSWTRCSVLCHSFPMVRVGWTSDQSTTLRNSLLTALSSLSMWELHMKFWTLWVVIWISPTYWLTSKMEHTGKPDTRQYLQDLIGHYRQQLQNPFWEESDLHNFIQEELYKCTYKLRKIIEADTEAMMLAKTSASPLVSMN